MAFQNLALFLVGKLVKDTTQSGSYLTVEPLATTLGDEDQMILTIPF
jgi:hypothetical protein